MVRRRGLSAQSESRPHPADPKLQPHLGDKPSQSASKRGGVSSDERDIFLEAAKRRVRTLARGSDDTQAKGRQGSSSQVSRAVTRDVTRDVTIELTSDATLRPAQSTLRSVLYLPTFFDVA